MTAQSGSAPAGPTASLVRRHFELTYAPGYGRFAHAVDAQIHPHSDTVLFTGTIVDDLDVGSTTRIGVANGGNVRRLTDGPGNDQHARWSPDGRTVAFLSDRGRRGQTQLCLLPFTSDGPLPEVRRTTLIDGVVESIAWAADGRSILVGVADLWADQGATVGPGTSLGEGPSAPTWTPMIRSSTADHRGRAAWIYDVDEDVARRVTPATVNVWEAAWCGATSVVAVISAGSSEGSWFDAHLGLFNVADGDARPLFRGPFQIGKPAGSPSGNRAVVISSLASDRGVVAGEAIVIDVETKVVERLDTGATDVTDVAWLDDHRVAYIGLRDTDVVAGVATVGGLATETWVAAASCGRHIPGASFAPNGRMAVVADTFTEYAVITTVVDGVERVAFAMAPAAIDELRAGTGSIDIVTWNAPDGTPIKGWLCRPVGPGPHPLVLHVHGGPVGATLNAWDMGNDTTRILVDAGYAVLHPNPRGSFGRGQAFVRGVLGDMGGADSLDLLAGVDAMVDRGIADPSRLSVVGTSYGGFMANLLPTRTDRFAAAVAMSPVTDWESFGFTSNIPEFATLFLSGAVDGDGRTAAHERSPLTHASRCRTPTLEVGGLRDRSTPFEQASRFYDALVLAGTRASLISYPEAGHGVQHIPAMIDLCSRVLGWLEEHVGGADVTLDGDRS